MSMADHRRPRVVHGFDHAYGSVRRSSPTLTFSEADREPVGPERIALRMFISEHRVAALNAPAQKAIPTVAISISLSKIYIGAALDTRMLLESYYGPAEELL